jgi:hypothetical protein
MGECRQAAAVGHIGFDAPWFGGLPTPHRFGSSDCPGRRRGRLTLKFTEAMIAWTPGTDRIAVGPWPDTSRWSDGYSMTVGACLAETHSMGLDAQRAMMMTDFNTCVVRDGIPPQAAHRAFLAIDEYRRAISPKQLGAEDAHGPLNNPWKTVVAEKLDHPAPYRRRS